MNRSRKRRKRLGLPPYGNNVMGVDVPNKMQRRFDRFEYVVPDGDTCSPCCGHFIWRNFSTGEVEGTLSEREGTFYNIDRWRWGWMRG